MFGDFLTKYSLHGNWIDLMFLILVVFFIYFQKGFITTFLESVAFIFSLIISYNFYSFFGQLLILNFSLSQGVSNALGFFIAWFISEIIFSVFLLQILTKFLLRFQKNSLNLYLGFIAAIIQAATIFLFFIGFIFAFPVNSQIKEAILVSRTGPVFMNISGKLEKQFKNVFGQAVTETLNFLTIKPGSNETVSLGFKATDKLVSVDQESESVMYMKINEERIKKGIKPLNLDNKLTILARSYAGQMMENGFFSHISEIDGSTPADRAVKAGISFSVIGENLAYAPDVYVAHQGLMNSEGHRKNILSTDYLKVGIGVVDAGIYGRMFVQEFTN